MHPCHRRHITIATAAVVTLLGLTACGGYTVTHDYDPQVSFANLQTFRWLDSSGVAEALASERPFLERRVRRAVTDAFEARGFAQLPSGPPDFLVTAMLVAPRGAENPPCTRRSQVCVQPVVTVRMGYGYPYGYGVIYPWYRTRGMVVRYPWSYVYTYRVGYGYTWLPVYEQPMRQLPGTLIIDVLNPTSRELLWRGTAETSVLASGTREAQDRIDEIAFRILEAFPPPR